MRRILKCLLAALLIAMVLMLSAAQADDGTAWIDEPCPVGEGGIHKDHWERVQIGDCTHDDIEIYSCEYCGKSHTYTYPAPGHQWDEGKVTKEATCTEAGERTYTCTRLVINAACGEKRTETIPALGHSWDGGVVTTAPTCTTAGVRTYTCSRCGTTKTETIPATGHSAVSIPAVAATCTAGGKTEGSQCSVCGTILTAQTDTAALGHSWDGGTVTTAATCTADGVKTYTCSRCGEARTEAIPATGHTAVSLPAVAATCTTGGKTEGSQCSVCGATLTAQHDTPALGHNWDEGKVTKEAGYLEEGEITYTCKRDASHTKKENLPVKELPEGYDSVMSLLRNDPPGAGHAQKLAIFRQPEGGVIDDGFELSVEAMGGIEPYSYEWRIITGSANVEAFASGADPTTSSLLSHRWRLAGKVCDRITGRNATVAEAGKKFSCADFGYGSIPRDNTASYYDRSEICTPEFFVGARVGEDAPAITATSAGIYYCIVRDSAGNYVASEKVLVNDLLYIVQQPMNLNLMGQDSVTLTCIAAGGMPFSDGSYMYMWCNGKGGDIKTGNENWIEITEEGEYYCLVQDNYGDPVTSDRATVYCAEPLTVTCDRDVYSLLPGEEPVTLGMTISGGVPPYEVQWTAGFETIDAFSTEETYLTKQVSDFESYGLAAKDSMGRMAGALCKVEYKQLQIAQEPVDGVLRSDENTPYTVSIVMAEGEAPFTYTLVKDDTNTNLATGESGESYSFDIWETGTHHIHVEDAAGRWADSSLFYVDDYCFRIYIIEKSGELTGPDDAVTLTALLESAEEDVTYRWWWMGSMEAQAGAIELSDGPVCIATRPGQYQCLATNRNGLDSTATVRVAYLGSEPIILQQPQSVVLPYEEGKATYPVTLTVNAITHDNRTDVLEYVWEYRINGEWLNRGPESNKLNVNFTSSHSPTYRCKVTDKRTGASITSDWAFVMIDLSAEYGMCDLSGLNVKLYCKVLGGAPPYTIEVYQHAAVDINDYGEHIYKDILFDTETIQNNYYERWVEYSYVAIRKIGDNYLPEYDNIEYFINVTDRDGQTFTTNIFEYGK